MNETNDSVVGNKWGRWHVNESLESVFYHRIWPFIPTQYVFAVWNGHNVRVQAQGVCAGIQRAAVYQPWGSARGEQPPQGEVNDPDKPPLSVSTVLDPVAEVFWGWFQTNRGGLLDVRHTHLTVRVRALWEILLTTVTVTWRSDQVLWLTPILLLLFRSTCAKGKRPPGRASTITTMKVRVQ